MQPRYRLKTILLALSLVLGIAAARDAAPARAQTEGLAITAEAGLDGYCKQGAWMPVRVTAENNGEDIDAFLYARTEGTGETWDFGEEISLPNVSRKQVLIYLQPIENENNVTVGLRDGGRVLAEVQVPVTCVSATDQLFGVWAENPSIFNPQTSISSQGRPALVQVDAESLPDRAYGLSMLDSLTISGVDTGSLTAAQAGAIAGWIAGGGRLIISGGPDWQGAAAGLPRLLPLEPQGTENLPDLSSIQSFTRSADPLDGGAVAAVGNLHPESSVLVSQEGIPLLVVRRIGLGQTLYFAADPALEPLRTWAGMEDLYQFVLGAPLDTPTWRSGFSDWREADEALNAFPGLGIPPVWLICGFLVFYIIVVGPLNFLALRTIKRREFAWITVPAIVIFFTGVLFLVGTTTLGSRPLVNRLSIVEVWPGEDTAAVHGLLGVFSPARDTFTLEVDSDFSAHPFPPFGFQADRTHLTIAQTGTGFRLPDLRVDIGGLARFAVTGQVDAPALAQDLTLTRMGGASMHMTGELTNQSGLTLQDALILTPGAAISIGEFGPAETEQVSATIIASASSPISPSPTGAGDDTLYEVFGTNFLYSTGSGDIEMFRQFKLLSAALGGGLGSRGNGYYLVGWTRESPYESDLIGASEGNADTTLYIFQLRPEIIQNGGPGEILLTPERFSWSVYGSPSGSNLPSAYDGYISSGDFVLQFVPLDFPTGAEISALTLNLSGYGASGPVGMIVQLWDFDGGGWVGQPDPTWGSTDLNAPARFVGPGGQVRVRISANGSNQVDFERIDVTMVVQP